MNNRNSVSLVIGSVLVMLLLAVSTMDYNDAKEYEQYKCSMIEKGAWGASKEVKLNCSEVEK